MLERIPWRRMSSRQKFYQLKDEDDLPMYKLRNEPNNFDEIDWRRHTSLFAIWRDNGTVIIVCGWAYWHFHKRNVQFTIHGKYGLDYVIYGETDADIAETITFLWSVPDSEGERLQVNEVPCDTDTPNFDFAALQPEQLAQILDANPTRRFDFRTGIFNADLAVVLATRPYPLNLRLTKVTDNETKDGFAFIDGGTAFVDALETRQSSFGSLHISYATEKRPIPFSPVNLHRLVQLEAFERLSTYIYDDEAILFPFSSKVDTLDYQASGDYIRPDDFASLDIATKDLRFKIYLVNNKAWDVMIAFLNRVAELGHFERLHFSICYWDEDVEPDVEYTEVPRAVAEALIGAINANSKLSYLDLSDEVLTVDWNPQLPIIFKALEEHQGLRTFILQDCPPEYFSDEDVSDDSGSDDDDSVQSFRLDYSLLEQLLRRNRKITVLDHSGNLFSNGSSIDSLYLLNRFHCGSVELATESASWRPPLIATALMERASEDFQYTSLVLSNHADVLCEFIQSLNEEGATVSPVSIPRNVPSKRKTRVQPTRAGNKAARSET